MKQFLITPAMGKKLIAKALLKHPSIQKTLKKGKLVIVAGTTNGYIVSDILKSDLELYFSDRHISRIL
ncbi:MAG: hypothetical protein KKF16_00960 [Euryarchaeota archaeon]|nr:hypothetical protein [Euryarchaeota archaeon]MBV1728693.1 hypothetical protein [Methanobacterium sp.]MBU4548330.1 hypothetical protein [Euryarchaeota archaeon]MBU4607077.1 hypothetical protein [Euryarchaeota archaeon]MBV1755287.1 hypothetical protein [Methanobacterium sp.]